MSQLLEKSKLDGKPFVSELDAELRAQALRQLEKKRAFRVHLGVYLVINALIWLGWGIVFAYTGFSFPWAVFPLVGWGIGLGFHAWDAYGRRPFSEEQIAREAARWRRRP